MFSAWMWNLLSLVFAAAGAIIGVCGTLMIANAYYPNGVGSFLWSLAEFLGLAVTFQRRKLYRRLEIAQKLANAEVRESTLMGVGLVFLGFCLQLVAAFCAFFGTLGDSSGK